MQMRFSAHPNKANARGLKTSAEAVVARPLYLAVEAEQAANVITGGRYGHKMDGI